MDPNPINQIWLSKVFRRPYKWEIMALLLTREKQELKSLANKLETTIPTVRAYLSDYFWDIIKKDEKGGKKEYYIKLDELKKKYPHLYHIYFELDLKSIELLLK